MKKLDNQGIKNVELDILLEFQKTCQKEKLKFYLAGGTLLGAVRHHGFIPWDDDIDVTMPRPDYQKLIRLYRKKQLFPDYLKLTGFELGSSVFPFLKLTDTRTKVEQQYEEDSEGDDALWIDILPVDGLPEDEKEIDRVYKRADFYRRILKLNVANPNEGKTYFKKTFKRFVIPFAKLYGIERANRKIISIARRNGFRSCNKVGGIVWGLYGNGEVMSKREYMQTAEVTFEGHTFLTMSCWDSYLTGLYGDYMKLPPQEKRKTHDMRAWISESIR